MPIESRKKLLSIKLILALLVLFISICAIKPANAQIASTTPVLFKSDLKLGSNGDEVKRLQQYLNTNGFLLSDKGVGSKGQETTFFGQLTKSSLIRFQQYFAQEILAPIGLKSPTGNFYSSTRSFINSRLMDSATTTASTTTSVIHRRSSGGRSSSFGTVLITIVGGVGTSLPPSLDRTVTKNRTTSIEVTALSGYDLSSDVGGTCPAGTWSGSVYTTGTITGPCEVSFSATLKNYSVTIASNAVTPHGSVTVQNGSNASFTVDANYGYGLGTISGTCPTGTWYHATYVTGTITGPCTVDFMSSVISSGVGSSIVASDNVYLRQNGEQLEYSLDQSTWNTIAGTPQIVNSGVGTLNVWLVGDFSFNSADAYFVPGSNNISFRGESGPHNPTVVSIVNVSNYPGLFQNGTQSTSGYDDVTVSDIFVNSVSSTLASGAGWVGQAYYGSGAHGSTFTGVASNGDIAQQGGGIVGQGSSGLSVNKTYSLGLIGNQAGGIVGANSSEVTVYDSYSSGEIMAEAGGIFGAGATNANLINAYSTGSIASDAGGIFGANASFVVVNNVYVAGAYSGSTNVYFGAGSNDYSLSAGVSEYFFSSSGWQDSHGSLALTGINDNWIKNGVNQPYRLSRFGGVLYTNPTQTVAPGGSTTAGISYYAGSFALSTPTADFTINATTGVVTASADVAPGDYQLVVTGQGPIGVTAVSVLDISVQ